MFCIVGAQIGWEPDVESMPYSGLRSRGTDAEFGRKDTAVMQEMIGTAKRCFVMPDTSVTISS